MKLFCILGMFCLSLSAAQDVASAVAGTVKAVDRGTKTVVVKTADGAEQTFHVAAHAVVHGAAAVGHGTVDVFNGLKDGDDVVVHYTARGIDKTGMEFDRIGHDGLHVMEGTGQHVDRAAKTISIKTADGTVQTFHFTDRLARETGADTARGTEKASKVTVYYTEDAGKKVVHFFKSS
jgi:hypothetical protein